MAITPIDCSTFAGFLEEMGGTERPESAVLSVAIRRLRENQSFQEILSVKKKKWVTSSTDINREIFKINRAAARQLKDQSFEEIETTKKKRVTFDTDMNQVFLIPPRPSDINTTKKIAPNTPLNREILKINGVEFKLKKGRISVKVERFSATERLVKEMQAIKRLESAKKKKSVTSNTDMNREILKINRASARQLKEMHATERLEPALIQIKIKE